MSLARPELRGASQAVATRRLVPPAPRRDLAPRRRRSLARPRSRGSRFPLSATGSSSTTRGWVALPGLVCDRLERRGGARPVKPRRTDRRAGHSIWSGSTPRVSRRRTTSSARRSATFGRSPIRTPCALTAGTTWWTLDGRHGSAAESEEMPASSSSSEGNIAPMRQGSDAPSNASISAWQPRHRPSRPRGPAGSGNSTPPRTSGTLASNPMRVDTDADSITRAAPVAAALVEDRRAS